MTFIPFFSKPILILLFTSFSFWVKLKFNFFAFKWLVNIWLIYSPVFFLFFGLKTELYFLNFGVRLEKPKALELWLLLSSSDFSEDEHSFKTNWIVFCWSSEFLENL